MVFHTTVIKNIGTNLAAPLNLLLAGFHLCLLSHAVLQLLVIEHGTQESQGILFVFRLVTCFCVFNEDFLFLTRVRVFVLVSQTYT